MQSETGESTAAINRRGDDQAMANIMEGLRSGGRLKLHRVINRAVLEGLPEKHPCQAGYKTITISRARRLEKEGVVVQSGIDQYMLAEMEG